VQLAEWTLPLLSGGGSLLALKGSNAQTELNDHLGTLRRLGVTDAAIEEAGGGVLAEPTRVVRLSVAEAVDRRSFRKKSPSSAGSARRRSDRPRRARRSSSSAHGAHDAGHVDTRDDDGRDDDRRDDDHGVAGGARGVNASADNRGANSDLRGSTKLGSGSGAPPGTDVVDDSRSGGTQRRGDSAVSASPPTDPRGGRQ
jgi:hypothetical protein